MSQRVANHETAIAPSFDPDPAGVDVGQLCQPAYPVLNVPEFKLAEFFIDRPSRNRALAARRAVVEHPDDDAVLREQLPEHASAPAPGVPYPLDVWAAVDVLIYRVPP